MEVSSRLALLLFLAVSAPAWADFDADGVADEIDNCVYVWNADQADAGGLLSLAPDGIGDVCQCGDPSDDGLPDVLDVALLTRALDALPPALPAPQKCDVEASGPCDADDLTRLREALAALPPGLEQLCAAAQLPPPFCGNDVVEGAEECDGADLAGETCASLGYASGALACSGGCAFDASGCVPFGDVGDACLASPDCLGGLTCVDGVCCTSTCSGTCQACDLAPDPGMCTLIPNGTDPDGECAGVSCAGYYDGWVGDVCYRKADASGAQVDCTGAGTCESPAQVCPTQSQGASTTACHPTCQDPDLATCTGVTVGACTNVNPGTQTCGLGACQTTVNQCLNGAPLTCTPGVPGVETCNGIDDDCNGVTDDGLPVDVHESNDVCGTARGLTPVGSDGSSGITNPTVYPSGDVDVYRVHATETDSTCGCGGFSFDEDYEFRTTLSVPASAGSYQVCVQTDVCTANPTPCLTVNAGATNTLTVIVDGSCTATDIYDFYVTVRGQSAPGFSCSVYSLSYIFDAGFCY